MQRYLPWFSIDSGGTPILVHQLLSHTAGLPDDYAAEMGYVYDIVALRAAKTLFVPGTSWSYSNDGYAVAGEVVARVDGRSWPDALRDRVLQPIGLTHSVPVFTPEFMANAAVGYQFRDNDRPPPLRPVLVAAQPMDFVDPAGSVLSTPEDMTAYMRFFLNGGRTSSGTQLIAPATFAAMTSPDTFRNGKPAGAPGVVLAEAPAFYKQYGYGLADLRRGRRSGRRPYRRDLRLYRVHANEPHARLRRHRIRESRRGAAASMRDRALRDASAARAEPRAADSHSAGRARPGAR